MSKRKGNQQFLTMQNKQELILNFLYLVKVSIRMRRVEVWCRN